MNKHSSLNDWDYDWDGVWFEQGKDRVCVEEDTEDPPTAPTEPYSYPWDDPWESYPEGVILDENGEPIGIAAPFPTEDDIPF